MATTRRLERLNAADLYVLMWDDFGWSGDIGGARRSGTGPSWSTPTVTCGLGWFVATSSPDCIWSRASGSCCIGPGWVWAGQCGSPAFDLADHVQVRPLAVPAVRARLVQACEQLAQRRLDPSRPLWELWLLPGLPDQRVGLFLKLHHAVADGVAGVAAFCALLDLTADAVTPPRPAVNADASATCQEGVVPAGSHFADVLADSPREQFTTTEACEAAGVTATQLRAASGKFTTWMKATIDNSRWPFGWAYSDDVNPDNPGEFRCRMNEEQAVAWRAARERAPEGE